MITTAINLSRERIIKDLKQVAISIFPDALNGHFDIEDMNQYYGLDKKTLDDLTIMWCELCEHKADELFKAYPDIEDILAYEPNDPQTKYWLGSRTGACKIIPFDNVTVVNTGALDKVEFV